MAERRRLPRVFGPVGLAVMAGLGLSLAAATTVLSGPRTVTMLVRTDGLAKRAVAPIFGVGTHFAFDPDNGYMALPAARRVRELGLASFRDDLDWQAYSNPPQPGVPPRIMAFIRETTARPLLILLGAPPGSGPDHVPTGARFQEGYADFARRVTVQTQPLHPILEIWNEWNMSAVIRPQRISGAGPVDDPRAAVHYAALATRAVSAIRQSGKPATVLVGAVGDDLSWDWTAAIIQRGALRGADGLSVHVYNHCEREADRTGTAAFAKLETLRERLVGLRQARMPLYVTEVGWPTATKGNCIVPREQAAENFAQFLLLSGASPWIGGVWAYQLKDQGRDMTDLEDNFGIFDFDYRPKPAACAVRDAIALVRSGTAWRIDRPDPRVRVLTTRTPSGTKLVLWATARGSHVRVSLPSGVKASAHVLCGPALAPPYTVAGMPVVIEAGTIAGKTMTLDFE